MKVVAIIQARMGSSRLPGKVMMLIEGKTILGHIIARLKMVNRIDEIVVATSIRERDDVIEKETLQNNVKIFRGSEVDVLGRFFEAAFQYAADIVVRITADCPLLDFSLITQMLKKFFDKHENGEPIDYLSNCLERTYPRGLDCEIFTFSALRHSYLEAKHYYQREHVTTYIYENPNKFKLLNYRSNQNFSAHRWTVDTIEDFDLITKIYHELYKYNQDFSTNEILNLLVKKPWLVNINKHIEQKKLNEKENVNAGTQ